ncbi:MAG: terpene cyclase/mutase family protein [Pirellulales bacterium]|nr:terpene cyclase/mutase family protein [Pirellulales bacterium]
MAVTHQDSHVDLPVEKPTIWLDGDVLACACPECGAPMSIRLWLMLADCFRCGTSLELTEEQEREAQRLLETRQLQRETATREASEAIRPTALRPPKPAAPVPVVAPPLPVPAAAPMPPRRQLAAYSPRGFRGAKGRRRSRLDWAKLAPAWLISLLVHLIGILLLGLWMIEPPQRPLAIFLSTAVAYQDLEGQEGELERLDQDAVEFETPGSVEHELPKSDERGTVDDLLPLAEMVDIRDPFGNQPDLNAEEALPTPAGTVGNMFQGRDPSVRANLVYRDGGTSFTEAAVTRGLVWISRHQFSDGRWSLHRFQEAPGCQGQCDGQGLVESDVAATALALLPMLGAGQTHKQGKYTDTVTAGLRWLVSRQYSDGDLRDPAGRMYAQGLATIVLCEAYGLTRDEQLREPAQKALDFIMRNEHRDGGWRYEPGQPADTSVVGWQLMALRSGGMAGLNVPSTAFAGTDAYLNRAQAASDGSLYAYLPGHGPTPTMTAEALLCRQYLGWPKDRAGMTGGVRYLMKNLPQPRNTDIYYWYYGSQVLHHLGGRQWKRWNDRMRVLLTNMQAKSGHQAGSWDPRGKFARSGGRLYMTSLAICTLEVYYRHLPLYRDEAVGQAQATPAKIVDLASE